MKTLSRVGYLAFDTGKVGAWLAMLDWILKLGMKNLPARCMIWRQYWTSFAVVDNEGDNLGKDLKAGTVVWERTWSV